MDQKGKTNLAAFLVVIVVCIAVYFIFINPTQWKTITVVRGTVEVHNTRQGEMISVGLYQYSGSDDDPLGDLITGRPRYTCKTSYSTETFSYEVRCFESEIEGNYFVVFVQGCPDGWKVLDVRDGPFYTIDLMRAWGEGIEV